MRLTALILQRALWSSDHLLGTRKELVICKKCSISWYDHEQIAKICNLNTVQASSVSNFAFRFLGKKSFMHGNDRHTTEVLQSCQNPEHFHNCFLTKSSVLIPTIWKISSVFVQCSFPNSLHYAYCLGE